MCLVCVEIQKGQLNPSEFIQKVQNVLSEDPDHEEELTDALSKADQKYLDDLEKFLSEKISREIVNIFNTK